MLFRSAVLQCEVATNSKEAPRVSGSHDMHYAPVTPTYLMSAEEITAFFQSGTQARERYAVMGFTDFQAHCHWVKMSSQPDTYAHDLYQMLRELDKHRFKQIIIECVPDYAAWDAIRDRLKRACIG